MLIMYVKGVFRGRGSLELGHTEPEKSEENHLLLKQEGGKEEKIGE